jgi:hypothetical protein
MDETLLQLAKVIPQNDIDKLRNIIIYQDTDGSFSLYGKYSVVKNTDGSYTVQVLSTYTEIIFHKLSNAIAWCSFDKRNLYRQANRLEQLDKMVYSMDTEIQIQSKLLKKAKDPSSAIIYLSKLTNNKAKKRSFNNEISNFVNESKLWQNRLFDKTKLLSQER